MRTYEPIWKAIKQSKSATIKADSALHKRIAKAVRKEKDNDKGWKLLELEKGKAWKLVTKSDYNHLSFFLVDDTPIIYSL